MISKEDSFPQKSDRYLAGSSVLFQQWNEVEFYTEDTNQERFYFQILKKLFPDVVFEKIFPLGKKSNVTEMARENVGNRTRVFIVDLDFDEILGKKLVFDNLFYLNVYSIENHLLDREALVSVIIEEKPKLDMATINAQFNLDNLLHEVKNILTEIMTASITIQKNSFNIPNVGRRRFEEFCICKKDSVQMNPTTWQAFINDITIALRNKDKRLKLHTQMDKFAKFFFKFSDFIKFCAGKYLLAYVRHKIEQIFGFQINMESFRFRVAKNCIVDNIQYLRSDISLFINQPA